jgi:hypothetical protein
MKIPIGLAILLPILVGCALTDGRPDVTPSILQAGGPVSSQAVRDTVTGKMDAPIVVIQNSRDAIATRPDSLKINGDLQTFKLDDILTMAQRKLDQGQSSLIALDLGRIRQTVYLANADRTADDSAARKAGAMSTRNKRHTAHRPDHGRPLTATAISRQTGEVLAYVIHARTATARIVRIPVQRQDSTVFTPELPLYGKLQTIQAVSLPPLVLNASQILEQARNAPVIPLSKLAGDIAAGRAKSAQQAAAEEQKAKETSQKILTQLAEAGRRGRQTAALAGKEKPAGQAGWAAPGSAVGSTTATAALSGTPGSSGSSGASGPAGSGGAGNANSPGSGDGAARAVVAGPALSAVAPGLSSDTCPVDTSALSERIPAMHISRLEQARSEAIRADVLAMMRQANRQGIAPEDAIRAAIQQSREFDKTTNNALRAAAAGHALGKSDDDFMAMVSDETLQINECTGQRNGALCSAIATRIASMKARNIAVAMSCHVAKGTWPK